METFAFAQLGINEHVCVHLAELGFVTPTPIQEQAIPLVLRGQDIIASAQTGSGKTASFLLPLLQILESMPVKARMPRALIMEPTRELALQVYEQFMRFSNGRLKAALLVGGESMAQQERALQGCPDVLIVTPGRVLDLCERQKLMLLGIRYVVIDEADRMLDMGFLPDVTRIMEQTPMNRQTLLFSATFNDEISAITHRFMLVPKTLTVSRAGSTVASIQQFFIAVGDKQKRMVTRHLLRQHGVVESHHLPVIIFCNRKTQVTTLVSSLRRHKFKVESLHGDLQQSTRNQAIEGFKRGDVHVLVATDIAARGLDVEDLALVINFDVPINAEDYVHRIGRTGRAGKSGFAYTLVEPRDAKKWREIEKLTQNKVDQYCVPDDVLNPSIQQKSERDSGFSNSGQPVKTVDCDAKLINDLSCNIEKKPSHKNVNHERKAHEQLQKSSTFSRTPSVSDRIYGFGDEIPLFFKRDDYRRLLTDIPVVETIDALLDVDDASIIISGS